MRILIATPLFPPDIADPAPYIKELAARLTDQHQVSVLAYGSLPEQVPHVTFYTVPKRLSTFWRLIRFTLTLLKTTATHDVVLVQNGASAELPAHVVSRIQAKKFRLLMSDQKVTYSGWRANLHQSLRARVKTIDYTDLKLPLSRPEIIPFKETSPAALRSYEESWEQHLTHLYQTVI